MNGGGVLIAIKNTLISEPVPELHTDCEIVWAKINLVGAKTLNYTYHHTSSLCRASQSGNSKPG